MHCHLPRKPAQARIRGVLAFRLGQRNVKSAYPIHFHLLGVANTSYVHDSAIYNSFYRCG